MKFSVDYLIRFQHCDPAGIVFYPHYFVMMNSIVEDWFAQGLECSFSELNITRKEGIPLVHTECDFISPSQIGDNVIFDLSVLHIGNSSFSLNVTGHVDEKERLRAKLILTYVSLGKKMKSIPIPDDIRSKMENYLES